MNDHNLDDLIIDNIDPKSSKTKSFLTIVALAIVVLIVAIILTKIILKDPNEKLILEEDNTELISPDLTLQSTYKESKQYTKIEHVKDELALNPNKKYQSTTIEHKITKNIEEKKKKQLERERVAQELKNKRIARKNAAKEKAAEMKRINEEKVTQTKKPLNEHKVTSNNEYFIQVGSFSKTPSSRFLSIIKNSGFNHQITEASSTGNKKLLIGPYETKSEANVALIRVKDRINKSAFVIKK